MKKKQKLASIGTKILCWVLAGMMLVSVGTYLIYAILWLM